MPYTDRFKATDDLITHLRTVVSTISDEELKSRYAGFLAASAVTVYELAIKDIFITFAENENLAFGMFVTKYFNRINGKINIDDIEKYAKLFGENYQGEFKKKLLEKNTLFMHEHHNNIQALYGNLVMCRHKYIHENTTTITFNEVLEDYEIGKEIIKILYETMQR
jgi:hypothetical protein